ncbi:hypothetical protein [Mesoterricola silvestris]|uniref:HAMP domain-containing protein n=1 Tax=Mesoterricola silvestris TaxID=2927979 RepID=A0AA48GS35_9BACT|nr:hypothetical protein [Mesoterricola silvestris]BDU73215.1 hypothetical protein METEAL_23890 [Mesoterricola silvestris]
MNLRHGIVARTTLRVMGIALALGLAALSSGGGALARRRERARQRELLGTLLDVVAPSASAACFADDGVLADQVVRGLLGTPAVQGARILAGGRVLAEAGRMAPGPGAPAVSRPLPSPFAPDSVLGELVLVPDPGEARRQGARAEGLFRAWSLGILAILAGGLALTVHRMIAAPLAGLSRDLQAGGRLGIPQGHARDELGQLVRDVNALLERMLEAAWKEPPRAAREGRAHLLLVGADGGLEASGPGLGRLLGREALPGVPAASLFGAQAGAVAEALARCRASGSALATLRLPDPSGPGDRWLRLTLDRLGPGWCQGLLEEGTPDREGGRRVPGGPGWSPESHGSPPAGGLPPGEA